jgi:hypothetical protein
VSDPDHEGLLRLPNPNLVTAKIDRQFQPIDDDLADMITAGLQHGMAHWGPRSKRGRIDSIC